MPNALYNSARQLAATTGLAWTSGTVSAYLIDLGGGYTFSAAHDFLDDVAAGAREAGPVNIGTPTATDGACGGNDITFSLVPVGPSIEAIIIYKNTGVESTSGLIAFIEDATGLPITPNGGNIIVTWDTGTNKIFRV